jgi:formylglycine-generating enzyme required for sulfatase activity
LLKLYGNVDDDAEAIPDPSPTSNYSTPGEPIAAQPLVRGQPSAAADRHTTLAVPGWPFDAREAHRRQQAAGPPWRQSLELGDGVLLDMVLIPAGEFIMGNLDGEDDERPLCRVRIERPYWMSVGEITNRQYALFDPRHDSRIESTLSACHGVHGHPLNRPEQPVVRVTWREAEAFCRWLSVEKERSVALPTEAQWEYAARAGTATPLFYGQVGDDFSRFANMADTRLSYLARDWYILDKPIEDPTKYDDWIPKDPRFDDGAVLSTAPGQYHPNAWGLCDMHGNVAEWTRSPYVPYPYSPLENPAGTISPHGRKVVRGGSWRDRPARCTSSFRLGYRPYQAVYNVGFRVVCQVP